jgi:hypothetical protein
MHTPRQIDENGHSVPLAETKSLQSKMLDQSFNWTLPPNAERHGGDINWVNAGVLRLMPLPRRHACHRLGYRGQPSCLNRIRTIRHPGAPQRRYDCPIMRARHMSPREFEFHQPANFFATCIIVIKWYDRARGTNPGIRPMAVLTPMLFMDRLNKWLPFEREFSFEQNPEPTPLLLGPRLLRINMDMINRLARDRMRDDAGQLYDSIFYCCAYNTAARTQPRNIILGHAAIGREVACQGRATRSLGCTRNHAAGGHNFSFN